jgi:hypothetical protein
MPDGPRSFVVDASHAVHVLDTLNERVAVFANGKLSRVVSLPREQFSDLDVAPDGSYVLLDNDEQSQIVFATARGVVTSQVPLVGQGLDDATTVTAISRENTGVWVELHHATWLLVATPSGQVVSPRVKRLGKPVGHGNMIQVSINAPTGVTLRTTDSRGQGQVTPIAVGEVHAITGAEQDSSGNTYVGVWSVSPTQERHELVVVNPSGSLVRSDPLPALGATQDTTRTLRMGKDGSIYLMAYSNDGLTVSRYLP